MFKWLAQRKEKYTRNASAHKLGRSLGKSFRAELDLFVALEIAPKRIAFVDVLRGQLATIDERLEDAEAKEVTRADAARIDLEIMLENWRKYDGERTKEAGEWLSEELSLAEAAGVQDDLWEAIYQTLEDEELTLVNEGIKVIHEIVPEARPENTHQRPAPEGTMR